VTAAFLPAGVAVDNGHAAEGQPMGPTVTAVIAGVVAALAAGAYLLLRRRGRRQAAAAFYHFRCPGCRRRLRFHSRQAGH
jgi:MYXO-CTERM domain-containing protein